MMIRISKKEILSELERQSSMVASTSDGASFEKIWVTGYDGNLLDTCWAESILAIAQLLKRYTRKPSVRRDLSAYQEDEVLVVDCHMPARFDERLVPDLENNLKMMVASNMMYRWMQVRMPDASSIYKENAEEYAKAAAQLILQRKEPERCLKKPSYDYIRIEHYDKCDHCTGQERNHEGCHGHCPCDRT